MLTRDGILMADPGLKGGKSLTDLWLLLTGVA
jgi:hypothetical protein